MKSQRFKSLGFQLQPTLILNRLRLDFGCDFIGDLRFSNRCDCDLRLDIEGNGISENQQHLTKHATHSSFTCHPLMCALVNLVEIKPRKRQLRGQIVTPPPPPPLKIPFHGWGVYRRGRYKIRACRIAREVLIMKENVLANRACSVRPLTCFPVLHSEMPATESD